MPDESELRESLRHGGSAAAEIDLDAVLRRARARRRPRLLAAAALGGLALTGVLVPVGIGALETVGGPVALVSTTGDRVDPEDAADGPAVASADRLNPCGGPLAEPEPAANGLVLEVPPVTADADTDRIHVVVTLRNTGTEWVRGRVTEPVLTLSRDGSVVWHSAAVEGAEAAIALAPGQALDFVVDLEPRLCAPEDDTGGSRPDLPAADPGNYRLSAALDFTSEVGSDPVLVTGPTSPVELR